MIADLHSYKSRSAIRRRRESASRRGRIGNRVKAELRMSEGPTWHECMRIAFSWPDGRRHELVVTSTDDPSAPLGLCVDGRWHKLASERTVRAMIARRIFREVACQGTI